MPHTCPARATTCDKLQLRGERGQVATLSPAELEMTVQTSTADFEPAAFIIMQKRSMFVLECAGEAVVSVLRLGSTEEPCEVDFETGGVGGHKATDADFVAVDGTLKFAPGQRSAAIRVPVGTTRGRRARCVGAQATHAKCAFFGLPVKPTNVSPPSACGYSAKPPPIVEKFELPRKSKRAAFQREAKCRACRDVVACTLDRLQRERSALRSNVCAKDGGISLVPFASSTRNVAPRKQEP